MAVGLGGVVGGSGAAAAGGVNGVGGPVGVNPCYVVEDYVWVDRDGRPTSPPHSEPRGNRDLLKKVENISQL